MGDHHDNAREYYRSIDSVDEATKQLTDEYDTVRFTTKDSGERQEFDTGMVRDTQTGKPRFDLIPCGPLRRLANLYTRGAEKYDDNNWKKGQPFSRAYASLFRHLIQWREGDRSEDHLAAVAWNAFALMYYEDTKPELDDIDVLPDDVWYRQDGTVAFTTSPRSKHHGYKPKVSQK